MATDSLRTGRMTDLELARELERASQATGRRIVIVQLPADHAIRMEIRAQESARPLAAEYGRAIDAWLGGPPGPP